MHKMPDGHMMSDKGMEKKMKDKKIAKKRKKMMSSDGYVMDK